MTPVHLSWDVHTRSPGVPVQSAEADGLKFEIYERAAEGQGRNRIPASYVLWHSGRPVMIPVLSAEECRRYAQSILYWREVAVQDLPAEREQYPESKFDRVGEP